MRLPRSVQLYNISGFVHQFWRCHNKEFYLVAAVMKALYLRCMMRALKTHNKEKSITIYAYTVMDNHFHNLMRFTHGSTRLSNFLRQAHSIFGSRFNKIHGRSGKVAEGRPKTSLIENIEHLMRVQFYIEANPLRAGKCTLAQLKYYKFSSYRFYAYGITDEFSAMLTVPDWYKALGKSAQQRRARYRSLFMSSLDGGIDVKTLFSPFIGSSGWKESITQKVIELLTGKKSMSHLQPVPSG